MHIGKAGPAGPKCNTKGFRAHTILYILDWKSSRSILPRDMSKVLPTRPGRKHFEVVP